MNKYQAAYFSGCLVRLPPLTRQRWWICLCAWYDDIFYISSYIALALNYLHFLLVVSFLTQNASQLDAKGESDRWTKVPAMQRQLFYSRDVTSEAPAIQRQLLYSRDVLTSKDWNLPIRCRFFFFLQMDDPMNVLEREFN